MATEFSDEAVRQLEEEFGTFLPPEPSFDDVEIAPKVERLSFAGIRAVYVDKTVAGSGFDQPSTGVIEQLEDCLSE